MEEETQWSVQRLVEQVRGWESGRGSGCGLVSVGGAPRGDTSVLQRLCSRGGGAGWPRPATVGQWVWSATELSGVSSGRK